MAHRTGSSPLVPTFHGFVQNSMDALLLFEACLSGKLHHAPRRPHDRERGDLIQSGSVFIYEENASGIKRWTDGTAWSPSRILGNFLIYRELEKPFPPGEKKRAMKRKRSSQDPTKTEDGDEDTTEVSMPPTPPSPKPSTQSASTLDGGAVSEVDRELERQLIGSLVDSYGFRPDGLVKKTMSVNVNGVSHHLVSYYKVDDVKNKILSRPMSDTRLQGLAVRPELYMKQNFRSPIEETEQYMVDNRTMSAYPDPYGRQPRPPQYMPPPQGYQMYPTQVTGAGMYSTMPANAWPQQPQPQYAPRHPHHQQAQQSYPPQHHQQHSPQQQQPQPQPPPAYHSSPPAYHSQVRPHQQHYQSPVQNTYPPQMHGHYSSSVQGQYVPSLPAPWQQQQQQQQQQHQQQQQQQHQR